VRRGGGGTLGGGRVEGVGRLPERNNSLEFRLHCISTQTTLYINSDYTVYQLRLHCISTQTITQTILYINSDYTVYITQTTLYILLRLHCISAQTILYIVCISVSMATTLLLTASSYISADKFEDNFI